MLGTIPVRGEPAPRPPPCRHEYFPYLRRNSKRPSLARWLSAVPDSRKENASEL